MKTCYRAVVPWRESVHSTTSPKSEPGDSVQESIPGSDTGVIA